MWTMMMLFRAIFPKMKSITLKLNLFHSNNGTTATVDNLNVDQSITDNIHYALHNGPDEDAALHNGCSAKISEERMKLIMLIVNIAMKLKMLHPELEIPTVNRVLNYSVSTKSRIPPSEYLKFLMADPAKNPESSSLPDFTSVGLTCFQQGEKWRNHPTFQAPPWQLLLVIWLKSVKPPNLQSGKFLVSKFFQKRNPSHRCLSSDCR
ncbi:hypothetical protein CLU79DRAFT_162215 [Phycomyces nitens]|nr:hypothetical protein CLU79DRAFT_162215 [Phycomyces nitens]